MDNSLYLGVVRKSFEGRGFLSSSRLSFKIPCSVWIGQLFTGRIVIQGTVEKMKMNDLPMDAMEFRGETDDGAIITIESIAFGPTKYDGILTFAGHLTARGYLEIVYPNFEKESPKSIFCELTNLAILNVSPFRIHTRYADVHFRRVSDYYTVRQLTRDFHNTGVLSTLKFDFADGITLKEKDEFFGLLTGLLSLSQRCHVWCVSRHWEYDGKVVKSRYEDPIFYHSRPSTPLIPIEALPEFLENTIDHYKNKYWDWKLHEVEEYYLQAVSLNSAWSMAIGFFTALETLKDAFINSQGDKKLGVYIPEAQFEEKQQDVAKQVMNVLKEHFDDFKTILTHNDERQRLTEKVKDLNRRAYKYILREMFKNIGLTIRNRELHELIQLRNQIIHQGSPNFANSLWDDPQKAFECVSRFASLVERALLTILEYEGNYEAYHTIFVGQEE